MKTVRLAAAAIALIAAPTFAQHEHHAPPPTPTPSAGGHEHHAPPPTPTPPAGGHEHHARPVPPTPPSGEHVHAGVSAAPSASARANLFQSDMALMTGMTPRDPMAASPRWTVMVLGLARAGYNDQGGPSGDEAFESTNWNMVHAGRGFGNGRLSLMLMNSLEPWTVPRRGSPELFQTGETFRGRPLVDRQHPHDFFMNLSATWRAPIGSDGAWWLQLAPVGEPTLGPTAFMHRASAGENPTAPLGHHWQDSTHITFNIATAGFGWRSVSLEGSAFHGQEPDEDRWDIEGGKLDSAAGRVRLSFPQGLSAQVSYGYLKDPEALEPGSTHRATASLHYGAEGDRPFAATLLWGRNDEEHGVSDSWLAEAAWQATPVDHLYGRAEWVEKDRHLLEFKGAEVHPAIELPEIAEIGALTVGYLRDLVIQPALRVGLGGDLTAYAFPSALERVYGDFPISWHGFVRVRWGREHGGSGSGHAGHGP